MIFYGGAEGGRTPDLVNAIHALSQLSYGPNYSISVTLLSLSSSKSSS